MKNNNINGKDRMDVVNDVGMKTLIANVILSVVKIIAGFVAQSSAMIADGVHTVSDVISTVAVMIGVKFSEKEADEGHPYGHERIESVVTVLLSLMLSVTGFGIAFSGIKTIVYREFTTPGALALAAAFASIVVKELMYRYTLKAAEKINSTALKADAWHHRSDAFSSIGTLVGIGGAILGLQILDPIAGIIVSVLIIRVGFEILMQGLNQLVDRAADGDIIKNIEKNIENVKGVLRVDDVKTRLHGSRLYVDVEISVDSNITVGEGHSIAETVHKNIEKTIPDVKHCMVHVNPYKTKKR
ncbi:cation-efflux pump [Tyzzerella sp. An114]|uniref:cation diffusion facilitator family transporter n=1 Tax=Tyzzerella sp. An114 TaxID=1965545 RepID=UPI000B42F443|nr:cation diffusion facilitator family transporter [Tyzzerella sp. An114]OUQ60630.1 cation-efflux pump [Tyzzerella sp. An114]